MAGGYDIWAEEADVERWADLPDNKEEEVGGDGGDHVADAKQPTISRAEFRAVVSGAAPGVASGGAAPGGAASWRAEPGGVGSEGAGFGGAEPEDVEPGGAELEGAESGGAEPLGAASSRGPAGASPQLSSQQLREWLVRRPHRRSGAPGAGGARDTGAGGAAVPTEAVGTSGVGDGSAVASVASAQVGNQVLDCGKR
ncbi:unnamed protein product [Closterium sp. NIES-53]